MTRGAWWGGAALLILAAAGQAQTRANALATLYDPATLRYWQGRYEISTGKLAEQVVKPALPPRLQAEFARIRLRYPLPEQQTGNQATLRGDLLQYYSMAGSNEVFLPALSLKFLDDLCIAYTWREARGEPVDEVFNYVAELKYKAAQDFPGGRYPQPLAALHIPETALQDANVNERALGRFLTARAFILGHELGHIMGCNQHANPLDRETCSDELGARVVADFMRKTEVAPVGVVLYFMAALHWEPGAADFATDAEWQKYLKREADHPLTGARLDALAASLEAGSGGNRDMAAVATQIRRVAGLAEQPEVSRSIMLVARAGQSARFPRGANATGEAFSGTYSGTAKFLNDLEDGRAPMKIALERHGDQVTGRYAFGLGDAVLRGNAAGDRLYFRWQWGQSYGNGVLQATDAGSGFRGTWGFRDASQGAGTWECHR